MENKKKKIGIPDLSWHSEDYKRNEKEVPDRLKSNPSKTEGELMTQDEIEEWLLENLKTLKILKEEDKEVFEKVYRGFFLDLEYLFSLGKIDEGVLEHVQDLKNFDFFD